MNEPVIIERTVVVPLAMLRRAVTKARIVYLELQPDAVPGECWAEFEALADLLPPVSR